MRLVSILVILTAATLFALPVQAATKVSEKPKTDSKQQLIIDVLPVFIQIYGSDPKNAEKAWWRKRISCGEVKSKKELTSSMQFHKSKKKRIGTPYICGLKPDGEEGGTTTAKSSGVTRRAVAGITSNPTVRIGIYSTAGEAIKVTANGPFQVREGADKILGKLDDGNEVSVSYSGGQYHVRGSGLENDTKNKIRFVPVSGSIMQITSYEDKSKSTGKNYNRFRGIIEVVYDTPRKELWAVNELKTELYLRGLAETSGEGPEEYLKALGIAARTYLLYHKVITGGRREFFDIGSTALDQIYRGYEFETLTPRFSSILAKTSGTILTDGEGDKPIASVYFSDSDGRTRSAKEVWNSSRFSYLQSVEDPHHNASACKGHCVGMSAQGAYGFAKKDNWDFKKILNYFYQGIKLVKAY